MDLSTFYLLIFILFKSFNIPQLHRHLGNSLCKERLSNFINLKN